MKSIFIILLFKLSVLLSSCGEDVYSNGVQNTLGAVAITNFEVVGTSASTGGFAPIYASENSGNFSLSWTVLRNDSVSFYSAELLLSEDAAYSNNDTQFYTTACDLSTSADPCQDVPLNCNFSTANILKCGNDAGIDVSSDVSPLPKPMYLLLHVCNNLGQQCKNESKKVEFNL